MLESIASVNFNSAITLLTEELDSQTVGELIEQFLADTPAQIAALHEALACGNVATLARTAHSVAGSSSTFGLPEIRSAALLLEKTALAGDIGALPRQIEALAAAYDQAVPELEQFIQL